MLEWPRQDASCVKPLFASHVAKKKKEGKKEDVVMELVGCN